MLGIITLRQQVADPAEAASTYTLTAIKDWTFLLGQGLVVGWGNGLILGYLMYRWAWCRDGRISGSAGRSRWLRDLRDGHHVHRQRTEPRAALAASRILTFPEFVGNSSSASTARFGVWARRPDLRQHHDDDLTRPTLHTTDAATTATPTAVGVSARRHVRQTSASMNEKPERRSAALGEQRYRVSINPTALPGAGLHGLRSVQVSSNVWTVTSLRMRG